MCGKMLNPLYAAKKTTKMSIAGAKAGTNFAADATKKTNRKLMGDESGESDGEATGLLKTKLPAPKTRGSLFAPKP